MSLLLVAFIFSFSQRQTQTGVPIEVTFPALPDQPQLAAEVYEQNPILDIEVEILNGNGIPGLAAKTADFLRSKRIDVVRSENADHFNHEKTMLILRNENYDGLKYIATAMGLSPQDHSRIRIEPNENLDVDVTLILGKDYQSITPFRNLLNSTF